MTKRTLTAATRVGFLVVLLGTSVAPAVAQGFVVGDRGELKIGDIWYPGVVYAAEAGRYQINRDGFGRGPWTPGEVRPEQNAAPQRPKAGRTGEGPFFLGERVEVANGGSVQGNVGARQNGSDLYVVDRYTARPGMAAQPMEARTADIRRLEAAPTSPRATVQIPQGIPPGTYVCTTYAGTNTTTLGKLRILGPTTYTGLTPDGSGPQRSYSYDPATGNIEWVGGMPNFTRLVQRSQYRVMANRTTEITVWYKIAADRFDLTMGCGREGA
ncbi:MAG: hypothetical protein ABI051_09495 [Vicinamibacterales bacterium]